MLLDQVGERPPVHVPSNPGHVLCGACGGIKRKVQVRKNMPAPVIAANPYDTPVQVDPSSQALIANGKDQVARAKAKAKRQAFAERVAGWDAPRIREEMTKLDEAVAAHENKIEECLRQRMILEDQLKQAVVPVVRPGAKLWDLDQFSDPSPPERGSIHDPEACPF